MSFIRKIKTSSGIYLARVENRRVDGKVKQTVLEWLGKAPDTEETLYSKINRLMGQLEKMQTKLNQARQKQDDLRTVRFEVERKALAAFGTEDVDEWMIDVRLRLLKVLSDGNWHYTFFMTGTVGRYIPPQWAARADPRRKYDLDRGLPVVVTRELQAFLQDKRIEKRGKGKTTEWRLLDRVWAEGILAKINGFLNDPGKVRSC
jgi:hypothetical protein